MLALWAAMLIFTSLAEFGVEQTIWSSQAEKALFFSSLRSEMTSYDIKSNAA